MLQLDDEPTEEEIVEYAQLLGIDPITEKELLWVAEKGITAPLPPDWKPVQTDDGDLYFFNFKNGESCWEHPCDSKFREMVLEERKKLQLKGTLKQAPAGIAKSQPFSSKKPNSGFSDVTNKPKPGSGGLAPLGGKLAPLGPKGQTMPSSLGGSGFIQPKIVQKGSGGSKGPVSLDFSDTFKNADNGPPVGRKAPPDRPKTARGQGAPSAQKKGAPAPKPALRGGGSRFLKKSEPNKTQTTTPQTNVLKLDRRKSLENDNSQEGSSSSYSSDSSSNSESSSGSSSTSVAAKPVRQLNPPKKGNIKSVSDLDASESGSRTGPNRPKARNEVTSGTGALNQRSSGKLSTLEAKLKAYESILDENSSDKSGRSDKSHRSSKVVHSPPQKVSNQTVKVKDKKLTEDSAVGSKNKAHQFSDMPNEMMPIKPSAQTVVPDRPSPGKEPRNSASSRSGFSDMPNESIPIRPKASQNIVPDQPSSEGERKSTTFGTGVSDMPNEMIPIGPSSTRNAASDQPHSDKEGPKKAGNFRTMVSDMPNETLPIGPKIKVEPTERPLVSGHYDSATIEASKITENQSATVESTQDTRNAVEPVFSEQSISAMMLKQKEELRDLVENLKSEQEREIRGMKDEFLKALQELKQSQNTTGGEFDELKMKIEEAQKGSMRQLEEKILSLEKEALSNISAQKSPSEGHDESDALKKLINELESQVSALAGCVESLEQKVDEKIDVKNTKAEIENVDPSNTPLTTADKVKAIENILEPLVPHSYGPDLLDSKSLIRQAKLYLKKRQEKQKTKILSSNVSQMQLKNIASEITGFHQKENNFDSILDRLSMEINFMQKRTKDDVVVDSFNFANKVVDPRMDVVGWYGPNLTSPPINPWSNPRAIMDSASIDRRIKDLKLWLSEFKRP